MSKRSKLGDSLLSLGVVGVAHAVFDNRLTLFLVGVFSVYLVYTAGLTLWNK